MARALARAGVVVLTRAERRTRNDLDDLRDEVAARSAAPVCEVRTVASGLEVDGELQIQKMALVK